MLCVQRSLELIGACESGRMRCLQWATLRLLIWHSLKLTGCGDASKYTQDHNRAVISHCTETRQHTRAHTGGGGGVNEKTVSFSSFFFWRTITFIAVIQLHSTYSSTFDQHLFGLKCTWFSLLIFHEFFLQHFSVRRRSITATDADDFSLFLLYFLLLFGV